MPDFYTFKWLGFSGQGQTIGNLNIPAVLEYRVKTTNLNRGAVLMLMFILILVFL